MKGGSSCACAMLIADTLSKTMASTLKKLFFII
jgi:hypothetical protein